MTQERELKLRFDPQHADSLRHHPVLAALAEAPPRVEPLHSTYFDTADHRLRDAGLALRVRRLPDGRRLLTLKSSPPAGLQLARGEWESPLAAEAPGEAELAALQHTPLAAMGAPAELAAALQPVCTTAFDRTIWDVRIGGAQLEVGMDLGAAIGGIAADAPRVELHELEIELHHGPFDAAFDLAWALAQDVALLPSPLSKAYRAAQAAGWVQPALPPLARSLAEAPRAGLAVAGALQQAAAVLSVGSELLQQQAASETVHQMRLQLRRLRALLRLLEADGRDVRSGARWLRAEWRWAGQLLGAVRDVDVCREQAQANGADTALMERFAIRRADRLDALLAYLHSPRFARALLAQARWAQSWEDGSWRAARQASGPWAKAHLQVLLRRQGPDPAAWRTLLREWDAAKGEADDALWHELHRIRLQGKALRYGLEWLAPWNRANLGDRAARWLKLLDTLQVDLGEALDTRRLAQWTLQQSGAPDAAAQAERGRLLAYEQARTGLRRALDAAQRH